MEADPGLIRAVCRRFTYKRTWHSTQTSVTRFTLSIQTSVTRFTLKRMRCESILQRINISGFKLFLGAMAGLFAEFSFMFRDSWLDTITIGVARLSKQHGLYCVVLARPRRDHSLTWFNPCRTTSSPTTADALSVFHGIIRAGSATQL